MWREQLEKETSAASPQPEHLSFLEFGWPGGESAQRPNTVEIKPTPCSLVCANCQAVNDVSILHQDQERALVVEKCQKGQKAFIERECFFCHNLNALDALEVLEQDRAQPGKVKVTGRLVHKLGSASPNK
jgi:hypothetical protein